MTYEQAFELLRRYNSEPFHLCHALTVSKVMRRMAQELGYGDEADFWATVGLLHDIDFEQWPNEHCHKCVELLTQAGADERL
ncbi:MAG TPA: hydrolase, partial [Candidatus Ventricola gallistercoris]|nr:hydrolase [Candidatus Ventricola gallistercoris]